MQHKDTIGTYNKYARTYDNEVAEFWDRFPTDFLKRFVDETPGKRVLDVGSGSGRDALKLRDLGMEVICQDGSKAMVDMTTQLGFESCLMEFAEVDFPEQSFDGIWAYTSLIHIPKAEAGIVIKKLWGMLKPGGTFVIGVIEGEGEEMVERKTMPGSRRYFKKYTSAELKELIEPIGFELVHEQTYQPHNSVYINQLYRAIEK